MRGKDRGAQRAMMTPRRLRLEALSATVEDAAGRGRGRGNAESVMMTGMDAAIAMTEVTLISAVAVEAAAGAEIVTEITERGGSETMRAPRMARKDMVSPTPTSVQNKPPPSVVNAEVNGANPLKTSEQLQKNRRARQRRKRGQRLAGRTLSGTAQENSQRRRRRRDSVR